jgi:hypothetical protein
MATSRMGPTNVDMSALSFPTRGDSAGASSATGGGFG